MISKSVSQLVTDRNKIEEREERERNRGDKLFDYFDPRYTKLVSSLLLLSVSVWHVILFHCPWLSHNQCNTISALSLRSSLYTVCKSFCPPPSFPPTTKKGHRQSWKHSLTSLPSFSLETKMIKLYQIVLILVPSITLQTKSASWGRFFSRSLWSEPMDHFILEESPSHSHHSPPGIIQLTPIQFIPTGKPMNSQRASSRIAPSNSDFTLDSSDVYYTIANYTSLTNQAMNNQGMNSPQSMNQQPQPPMDSQSSGSGSHSLDKTLLDLLMATNASMPLSSEKYFWISSNTRAFDNAINGVKEDNDLMNSIKNDVTNNPSSDRDNEDNLPHTKVVSLCDKTLALLDWIGKDPATAHLSKCELFDLEKSPELAYTEAKKTGIPIQNVSFREMRDIINACRVLAESDTIPNGQLYPLPTPPSTGSSVNSDSYPGINQGGQSSSSSKNNGTKPASPSAAPTTSTTSSADKSFLWNSWRGIFPGEAKLCPNSWP